MGCQYQGETFPLVEVGRDKIILKGKGVTVELPMEEVACLGNKICEDKECRMFVDLQEANNCLLNLKAGRCFTLQEIGDCHGGISREAARQSEEKAIRKFRQMFRRMLTWDSAELLEGELPEVVWHAPNKRKKWVTY